MADELTPDRMPVEPAGGAGLYDVDPIQKGVTQDPEVPVAADAEAVPEDVEL